ncbi:pyridoxamine 5'-phosphate oxidase-domain-containing protein [Halteromyces radiatus]|uniref:pyridoxamine 5'-phosphate oxidase-domain-containing protein n=1 Tax=Halteromyces radiatus TaxID=101107 RepID=UPI002220BC41|nr:pyridoxamine 5'-phosphate oxidase-domain-containing protein [Halteromyces radiatus]KAI8100014.1 pyridoxamine 5'-phosphate oxidase-domain-containing protein [Halteromyces radiatus]
MTTPLWKKVLWEQLQKNIQKQGLSSCFMTLCLATPSARTVVFRSFAGEDHADELGWTSNCLVVTSDKRSNKFKELQNNRDYEVCWFMHGTGEQYRLKGTVFIYPQDEASSLPPVYRRLSSSEQQDIKSLGSKVFLNKQQGQDTFDWEAERRRHFANLDGWLRATFSPKKISTLDITGLDDSGEWFISPNQQDLNDAYENFCLIILTVKQMDYVSLSGERKLYTD